MPITAMTIAHRSCQRPRKKAATDPQKIHQTIAIDKAKRLNLPATDLVRQLAIVTKDMAYRIHDVGGWTASYFGHIVDLIVVERYRQTQHYAEELKRKELPNAFAT